MTAIFATLHAPSFRPVRSQRRAPASALLLAALVLSACGGLSVRHDDPDAGTDVASSGGTTTKGTSGGAANHGQPTSDDNTACQRVCQACLGTAAGGCNTFCDTVLASAQQAGCSAALSSLLKCQVAAASGCSTESCPSQNNGLSVCVLDYCDTHPADSVCVAPL